jgi:hypothetical protein
MENIINLINIVDLFRKPIILRFSGSNAFSTIQGIIISLMIYGTMIFLSLAFMEDVFF